VFPGPVSNQKDFCHEGKLLFYAVILLETRQAAGMAKASSPFSDFARTASGHVSINGVKTGRETMKHNFFML
jgi:hypothetical protein